NGTSDSVGIGDASADAKLEILSTGEQLRLTNTDGTKDLRVTLDASGNLTFNASADGTGSQTFTLTGFTTLSTALTSFTCSDCIDFDSLKDAMTIDAPTTIAYSASSNSTGLDLNFTNSSNQSSVAGFEITPTITLDAADMTMIGLNI